MKKLCLFLWVVLLLQACQNTPVKVPATTHRGETYAYPDKRPNRWIANPDTQNTFTALNAIKAYETGDTARMRKYLADSIIVYYDGGIYKGGKTEFMYAIKEQLKLLPNLRINVKDWQSVKSEDSEQQRVVTWYTQYFTNKQNKPDSADVVDDALFKDGKITVWHNYTRKYN